MVTQVFIENHRSQKYNLAEQLLSVYEVIL
jgi:hypothetical protein